MTYDDIDRKYQRLSHENTLRARRKDTSESYVRAQNREKLLRKAFFRDCKRYLKTI